MGQRRGQGEIRQRADEVHRQRISPPELHEIALPAPQQYVRAHTNVDGCYGAFFERDFDKVVFLEQTLSWPHFGDPTFTFCDVERAVKRRLRAARVIDIFRLLEADATRRRELGTLARLQEKYGVRTPPPDLAPTGSQIPTRRADNAHAIGHELGGQASLPLKS
jgi:hypothetical protein